MFSHQLAPARRSSILFTAASVAVCMLLSMSVAFAELSVGDAAPDFELKDYNGKSHKLSDLKGKTVVLKWTNPGCPFDVKHLKNQTTEKLAKKYEDVVFIGINSTNEAHADFLKPEDYVKTAKDYKIKSWVTVYDTDGKVGKAYGAKTTPHCFVIDKDGKIAYMGAYDDNKSFKHSDDAKNYIDAALSALKDGKTPETTSTTPYGCSVKYAKK